MDNMRISVLHRAVGTALLAASASLLLVSCASTDEQYFMNTESDANVYVAPTGSGNISKIAIMPFKGPTDLIGQSVSDMFVTEILRSQYYELVERSQMANVLSESELALSGLSATKAAEVGGMMGADGVMIGTVSEYETVAYRGRTIPVVGISARLIDCKSGKIVWSVDMAKRGDSGGITLPEHARHVVHEMMAGLYQKLRAVR
jgi:curli biogenesis system outer membrane secretion channel CsgG